MDDIVKYLAHYPINEDTKHFKPIVKLAIEDILLEYAEPFLAPQGTLIVMKANVDEIELQDASQAAKIFGYENVSRETFELPNDLGHREILLYKKVAKSKIKLPRKTFWCAPSTVRMPPQ